MTSPTNKKMQIAHEMARDLVIKSGQDPHLALAIQIASFNLTAAAAASDAGNPAKSLKAGLKWYRENATQVFQVFIRRKQTKSGKSQIFDA